MDRSDIKLGFLFAYLLAAALHAGLAFMIYRRRPRLLEIQVFAGANLALAGWHLLQLMEYGLRLSGRAVAPQVDRLLAMGQLLLGLTVLVLFFHLFATFERVYRRRAPSLRAAITTHVHRHSAAYVPAAYGTLLVLGGLYLLDGGFVTGKLAELRSIIGPTSAYLFGFSLLFMTFVLFPARPGQEKVVVATLARGLFMLSLAVTLLLIALWHRSHPLRVSQVLLPVLHLHTVAFVVFLGLVRYEFSFMDSYIREGLKLFVWAAMGVLAFVAFNRILIEGDGWERYATSLARLTVLLAAIVVAPAITRAAYAWSDRVVFDRDVDLAKSVHRFARRLSQARGEDELIDGATRDINQAVHPKKIRILKGNDERIREIAATRRDGNESFRLAIPMDPGPRTVGWILVGDRRNFYPYFDAEREYLHLVAELLGGAIEALGGAQSKRRPSSDRPLTPIQVDADLKRLQRELEGSRRELSRARAELREMHERLDPELMDEVLTVAAEVADRDPEAALSVLSTLHTVYAYLQKTDTAPVPLHEEMAFAQDYLALEKLRTRNRLEVTLAYDESLRDQELPRRLLQPLIENALIHGLSGELRSGSISISARTGDDRCRITVADNGRGFAGNFHQEALTGEGGLARVLNWLRARFGEQVVMSIDSPVDEGTALTIDIPRRDLGDSRRIVA